MKSSIGLDLFQSCEYLGRLVGFDMAFDVWLIKRRRESEKEGEQTVKDKRRTELQGHNW